MSETRQYCTFILDGLVFGVEVLKVQEVLRAQRMTHVPLSSDTVQGLINLRGQIVTAIDLRRRLGLAARPAGMEPMNVVVRTDDGSTALSVDEIGEVVELRREDAETAPETLSGTARELVQNVFQLKERLLLILDIEKAIAPPPAGARAGERMESRAA